MTNHLFLASTPFNALTASMIAFSLPTDDTCDLWLIDQSPANNFAQTLENWSEAPFRKIERISLKAPKGGKQAQRRATFDLIRQRLPSISPDRIYTGNDRRIEFQYIMHLASRSNSVTGVYMDDGTYSYLGRKTHWLKDKVIDNLAKKLAYGFWWHQPPAIGASGWIAESFLAFPEAAIPILKQRPIKQLPLNLERQEFHTLAQVAIGDGPGQEILQKATQLIMLPHHSVASPDTLQTLFKDSCSSGGTVVKRHPRSSHKDYCWLPDSFSEIDASLPTELLLPLLPVNCSIIGSLSTALLTAKWLRPELTVNALATEDNPVWLMLLQQLGINVIRMKDHDA